MDVNYEKILQHSNQMKNYVKVDVASLDDEQLLKKPGPKKWSAVEVIEHLNKVYDIYLIKFHQIITNASDLSVETTIKKEWTVFGWLSIYAMKPKNKKRRFKVKTFDFFRPAVAPSQIHSVIETFLQNKETFNELVRQSKTKDLKGLKVSTSLGGKIKFYVPECFEFILAHEERHMVQIEEVLILTK